MDIDDFLDNAVVEESSDDVIDISDGDSTEQVSEKISQDSSSEEEIVVANDVESSDVSDFSSMHNRFITLIKDGNLEKAIALYDSMVKHFESIPVSKIDNILHVNKSLLEVNSEFISLIKKYKRIYAEKEIEIQKIMKKCLSYVEAKDISSAEKEYLSAKDLFKTLPNGFPQRKDRFETQISVLKNKIDVLKKQKDISDYTSLKKQIISLLKDAHILLKEKKVVDSLKTVNKIFPLYEKISDDLIEEKIIIYDRILDLKHSIYVGIQIKDLQKEFKESISHNKNHSSSNESLKSNLESSTPETKNSSSSQESIPVPKPRVNLSSQNKKLAPENKDVSTKVDQKVSKTSKQLLLSLIRVHILNEDYEDAKNEIESYKKSFSEDNDILLLENKIKHKANSEVKPIPKNDQSQDKVKDQKEKPLEVNIESPPEAKNDSSKSIKSDSISAKDQSSKKDDSVKTTDDQNSSKIPTKDQKQLSEEELRTKYLTRKLMMAKYHLKNKNIDKLKIILNQIKKIDPKNKNFLFLVKEYRKLNRKEKEVVKK